MRNSLQYVAKWNTCFVYTVRWRLHLSAFEENESELTIYLWKSYHLGGLFTLIQ